MLVVLLFELVFKFDLSMERMLFLLEDTCGILLHDLRGKSCRLVIGWTTLIGEFLSEELVDGLSASAEVMYSKCSITETRVLFLLTRDLLLSARLAVSTASSVNTFEERFSSALNEMADYETSVRPCDV